MRDPAIDYLRSTLTVMVVAHHSALAYTTFARAGGEDYRGGTAPVVDETRWVVLDHAQNFNDVFFMSAMFFISGLFLWPSIKKVGAALFLRARAIRLGLPFAVGTAALMPLAYYPAWLLSGGTPGYLSYWAQNVTQHGFTPGPLWFIWMLLAFNITLAALSPIIGPLLTAAARVFEWMRDRPLTSLAAMLVLLSAAYYPFLILFGPDDWGALPIAPFYGQLSRVILYFTWFLLGVAIGRAGLDNTVFRADGPLARRGVALFFSAIAFYLVMNFLPRILFALEVFNFPQARALYDALWVPSCILSTVGFFALFQKAISSANWAMEGLSRTAYGIYIVHYLFVLWLQWALMGVALHAGVKFVLVFVGALFLSWLSVWALLRIPLIRRVL